MLKDLHELGVALQTSYQTTFTQEDKELPVIFKQLVNNIEGSAVNYNRNSFVVTVNYSNQKIYFPNQLWYIAAYFADFYKALTEYAQIIKNNLHISDENIKKAKDNKEIASSLILHASVSDDDKEYLIRFLYDYNWWYGGKGIERADYYVSPILSLCKLVNASQSYVAELCKFLARNEEALDVLKQVNDHREQNRIQILEDDVLNSFVYKLLKYIETEYTFDALASYARYTDANRLGFNDTLIHFELEDKKTHSIFIQTSDESNITSRNSGKIKRWYEDIFHFNQKDVYLTTQWGADTVEPLIFIINNAYKGKLEVSKIGDKYILHVFKTGLSTTDHSSYLPYLTALRTKPFMLLAGISGTGKSRIVKELAFMTCPNEEGYNNDKTTPGNYCLIEVKPNWHDSSELLGYYNALDGKYELTPFIRFVYRALQRTDVPFFVCLDEMNLAPVEQYFAEYLSVLETRTKDGEEIISAKLIKKEAFNGIDVVQQYKDEDIAIAQYLQENGLPLPSNLYIVGTVNMDDTTHQFSRKVIDRAFTIEMNGGKLEDMFKPENANALQYRDKAVSMDLFKSHFVNATEVFKDGESDTPWTQYETKIKTDVPARLKAINDILKDTPFQVSYRVQNELILYLAYLIKEAGFPEDIEPYIGEATLAILMEKILPRIQGDDKLLGRGQNKDVFTELSEYVEQTLMTRKTTDEQTKLVEGSDLYRKVIDKLDQMHKRLENSYFANFF